MSGNLTGTALANAREATVRIVVTRADGTVQDLGVVAYWHRNPLRRLASAVRRWLIRTKGNRQ